MTLNAFVSSHGSGSGSSTLQSLQYQGSYMLPKFANRMAGAATRAVTRGPRVMIMGDSTGVCGVVGGIVQGWGAYIANMMTTIGASNAGYDCVFASAPALFTEGRLVLNSSWTRDATMNSILGQTATATTSTNALVFTPNNPTTRCKVWYITQPGNGVLSIDAAGFGTLTADSNAANGVASLEIANALQPYNVKWVSGGKVNVIAMEAYDTNNPGMTVLCGALGGSSTTDWSDTTNAWSWLNAVVAMAPDLVIMAPGVNDMSGSTSSYQTRLTTIITTLQAAGIDILMLTPIPQNPTDGSLNRSVSLQDSFVNINRALASQYSIPLIDVYAAFRSYAYSSTLPYNLYTDTWVHPSASGWGMIASMIVRYLIAVTGFGWGGNTSSAVGSLFRRITCQGDLTTTAGNVAIGAGYGLRVGTAATVPRIGTGTLAAGTVTIFNSSITASTHVVLTSKGTGATNAGALSVSARTAGVSFTVLSTNGADTSTFDWMLVERT